MPLLTGQKNISGRSLPASWLLEQLSRARMTSSWPRACVFLPRLRNRHELLTCASCFCTRVRHRGPPESARSQRGWQAGWLLPQQDETQDLCFSFVCKSVTLSLTGASLLWSNNRTRPVQVVWVLHLNLLEQSLKSEYF